MSSRVSWKGYGFWKFCRHFLHHVVFLICPSSKQWERGIGLGEFLVGPRLPTELPTDRQTDRSAFQGKIPLKPSYRMVNGFHMPKPIFNKLFALIWWPKTFTAECVTGAKRPMSALKTNSGPKRPWSFHYWILRNTNSEQHETNTMLPILLLCILEINSYSRKTTSFKSRISFLFGDPWSLNCRPKVKSDDNAATGNLICFRMLFSYSL